MRSLLLWFLGVPIPIIILIALFMHQVGSAARRNLVVVGATQVLSQQPRVSSCSYRI
ncbi:hypothetical protein [Variovorax sp. PBL-E5]|uniref:hypothetical protein n=1 Tax=Variovorax sp. PBL-E5 TaxID=434014 RepID=UPI0013167606|nr:hypothetical protein [Variovorax sp. PBL-E5]VTU26517.1 hypothetical protein E5CHR_02212 [Variovorax sp. PBL-E5]